MAYNYTDVVFPLKGLTPTVKLVLLHLAEHADKDTGECWPGFGRLADFTGLTRRSIIYSINLLEKMEFITITPPTTRKTNTYVLHMDKLVAWSLAPVAEKAKRPYNRTGKYRKAKEQSKTKDSSNARQCPYCDAKIAGQSPVYLERHIQEKHAEEEYVGPCKVCGELCPHDDAQSERCIYLLEHDEQPTVEEWQQWSQLQPAFNIEDDDDDLAGRSLTA